MLNYDHLSAAEATSLQRELYSKIDLRPLSSPVTTIGGSDISYNKFSNTVYAGIVVMTFPGLKIIEEATVTLEVKFPYIPGLLAFREMPALMQVWEKLHLKPDVLVLDGQGIAHPRRMGIATHFGIVARHPTMGCGKSLLTGKYVEPAPEAGSVSDLIASNGDKIGEVLRTKNRTNPVYISPGNLITQVESTALIMKCVAGYRIPEPTRQAHLFVNRMRMGEK